MNDTIIANLKKVRAKLDSLKQEKARLQGRKQQLMDRLVSEFRISSLGEAKKRVKELGEELEDKETRLSEMEEELAELMQEIGK